jgi:nucleotide-binding universal stress UspA family protein
MVKIKLYGQPSSTYEYAKMKVLEAVDKAGISMELKEINDVNEFIKDGIKSVPTFKVNDCLEMSFNKNNDLDQFIRSTVENILKEDNYGSMTKIVVPTDFSESSRNALKYAYHLAQRQNKVIQLVHAYHPVSADIDGMSIMADPHLENIKRKELKELCLNSDLIEDHENTAPFISQEFRVGFAVDEIVGISRDKSTDMIVMGSTGRGNTMKKWFGSVSLEVVKNAKSPVLIVPPSAEYREIQNVLYATDNPLLDGPILETLSDFFQPFDINLHLVHVIQKDQADTYKAEAMHVIEGIFKPGKITYHAHVGEDVSQSIEQYAQDQQIDVVVMTRKKRNFLNTIINPSVTTKMAIHTNLPLIVFHEGGKLCNCGGACKKIKSSAPKC